MFSGALLENDKGVRFMAIKLFKFQVEWQIHWCPESETLLQVHQFVINITFLVQIVVVKKKFILSTYE